MTFEDTPLCPGVRGVVVRDIAEQQAHVGSVDDESEVVVYADGEEGTVLRLVQPMEAHPRAVGIHLEVEGCRLNRPLFVPAQSSEAVREGVRDQELHQSTRKTFMTSSPRWLITFTAMRPDSGFGKGREVSLCRDSHASSLISALSVVFSALYGSFAPRK